MKLLFDNNLSPRLAGELASVFPGSAHVREFSLERADDDAVWHCAISNGFTIVSKDSDFHQRSLLDGFPPKVIWIQRGNCLTQAMIELLRANADAMLDFGRDPQASFLVLE